MCALFIFCCVVSRDGRSDHLHCPAPTESFTPARAVSRWPAWAVLEMRKKNKKRGFTDNKLGSSHSDTLRCNCKARVPDTVIKQDNT